MKKAPQSTHFREEPEFSAKFTDKLVSMQFPSKLTLKESLCRPNCTAYFAVNFSGTNSIVNFAEFTGQSATGFGVPLAGKVSKDFLQVLFCFADTID